MEQILTTSGTSNAHGHVGVDFILCVSNDIMIS